MTPDREAAWRAYAQAAGPSKPVEIYDENTGSRYPSTEELNLLPDRFRRYIHDLQTRVDPAGDVRLIAELRDQVEA